MKKLVSAAFLILLAYSCKKDAATNPGTDNYLPSVLSHLKDSLSAGDFGRLDTTRAYLTNPPGTNRRTLRLAFVGKAIAEDFLLLQTDDQGNIRQGRVVHLEGAGGNRSQFSGRILLTSLSGRPLLQSTVSDGFIDAFHQGNATGNHVKEVDSKSITLLPAPGADWLPEVVVIGYGSGAPPSNYASLDGLMGISASSLLNSGAGGGSGASGASGGGNGAMGGGSSNNSASDNVPSYSPLTPANNPTHSPFGRRVFVTHPLQLEQEYIYSIPIVDVRKFFNCFDQIPDVGASYSVQLCVDVPINGNPAASINFSGVSSGHTFLVVTKSGGGASITQSFGYYPATKLSIWEPFGAVPSTIKDNGGQEINGSLSMSMGADQFKNLRAAAINFSTRPYILDSSNCTDYALNVFNAVRASPIVLEPYIARVPGVTVSGSTMSPGFSVTIPNSPQGLYERLSQMKAAGGPEASNIHLDLSHNLRAAISHGQCN